MEEGLLEICVRALDDDSRAKLADFTSLRYVSVATETLQIRAGRYNGPSRSGQPKSSRHVIRRSDERTEARIFEGEENARRDKGRSNDIND